MTTDIARHRTAQALVTLLRSDGIPLANQQVTVAQTNHKFLFGTTGFSVIGLANDELTGSEKEKAQLYNDRLLELFNFVTLPFYWGRFEPQRGLPDTQRILKTARWFAERGCLVKGHPLCWHTVTADWLLGLTNGQIIDAQRDRIRRDVADFAGLIDMWDVINEVVIMPNFDKYENGITRIAQQLGRIGIIRMTFDAARAANPRATLLLNDFDVSAAYECLIEGVLEAGIKIDALGIQSHMHQGYWGVEKTQQVLARYSRYKLPIHFTESTLVSGKIMPADIVDLNDYEVDSWPTTPDGEQRQAQEVTQHYQTLFAHPLVEAITWWGLDDGGWLKAPSGLIRIDQSPKPAFHQLTKLIKYDWWLPPTSMSTNAAGEININGCLGEYSISHQNQTGKFQMSKPGPTNIQVRFQ